MSFVQRLVTSLVSRRTAESMRAHSQSWMAQCAQCGCERSVWEMGGIRWKAVGNQRSYRRCTQCGQRSWHTFHRKPAAPAGPATSQG